MSKSFAVSSMFLSNNHRVKDSKAILESDILSQSQILSSKLAARKTKNAKFLKRKYSLASLQDSSTGESDSSAGIRSPVRKKSIESDLVTIMERWYAVKASKIADIKVQYTQQINELESELQRSKSETYAAILEATKQAMSDEIAKICEDIDNKRKEDIRLLREQYKS